MKKNKKLIKGKNQNMICKDAKNQQAKKNQKMKKRTSKIESEYDIKKMPNHVNFERIRLCLMCNVILTLTPS
jgi:hypothetical protein